MPNTSPTTGLAEFLSATPLPPITSTNRVQTSRKPPWSLVLLPVWRAGHPSSPRRPPRASRFRYFLVPRQAGYLLGPGIAPPLQLDLTVLLRTTNFTVGPRLQQLQDQHLPSAGQLLFCLSRPLSDPIPSNAALYTPPRRLHPLPHLPPPNRNHIHHRRPPTESLPPTPLLH